MVTLGQPSLIQYISTILISCSVPFAYPPLPPYLQTSPLRLQPWLSFQQQLGGRRRRTSLRCLRHRRHLEHRLSRTTTWRSAMTCVCTVRDQVFKVLNLSYKFNFDFYPVTADQRDGGELAAKRAGVQSEGLETPRPDNL